MNYEIYHFTTLFHSTFKIIYDADEKNIEFFCVRHARSALLCKKKNVEKSEMLAMEIRSA